MWLASEIDLTPSGFDGGQEEWRDLAARHTERALVAYAGSYDGRPSVIKVYLTLDDPEVSLKAVCSSMSSKGLPAAPLDRATVLLCQASYAGEAARSRVYLIYPQEAFEDPCVSEWMRSAAGERAFAAARAASRAAASTS